MPFDPWQSMLDAVADPVSGLGVSITIERETPGPRNTSGGRDAGPTVTVTVSATTTPSVATGDGGKATLMQTTFKVRRTVLDAAIAAGGFEPAAGDTVVHGTTRTRIAQAPSSTTNGLDVVLVCQTEKKKG